MRAWWPALVTASMALASAGQVWAVSSTNLVGYWQMDDGTGTSARDSAGSANGTLRNFVAENFTVAPSVTPWTGGRTRGALDFDGTDSVVTADDTGNVWDGINQQLTVSAWVRPDVVTGWRAVVSRQKNDASGEYFYLGLNGTNTIAIVD